MTPYLGGTGYQVVYHYRTGAGSRGKSGDVQCVRADCGSLENGRNSFVLCEMVEYLAQDEEGMTCLYVYRGGCVQKFGHWMRKPELDQRSESGLVGAMHGLSTYAKLCVAVGCT